MPRPCDQAPSPTARRHIGEAARHVPDEITALAPGVPWAQIRGMRNVMTHAYFDIETDVLWTTIARDIPVLAAEVAALRERLPG